MMAELSYRQDYMHGCSCADRLSLYYTRAFLYGSTVLWPHFSRSTVPTLASAESHTFSVAFQAELNRLRCNQVPDFITMTRLGIDTTTHGMGSNTMDSTEMSLFLWVVSVQRFGSCVYHSSCARDTWRRNSLKTCSSLALCSLAIVSDCDYAALFACGTLEGLKTSERICTRFPSNSSHAALQKRLLH